MTNVTWIFLLRAITEGLRFSYNNHTREEEKFPKLIFKMLVIFPLPAKKYSINLRMSKEDINYHCSPCEIKSKIPKIGLIKEICRAKKIKLHSSIQ